MAHSVQPCVLRCDIAHHQIRLFHLGKPNAQTNICKLLAWLWWTVVAALKRVRWYSGIWTIHNRRFYSQGASAVWRFRVVLLGHSFLSLSAGVANLDDAIRPSTGCPGGENRKISHLSGALYPFPLHGKRSKKTSLVTVPLCFQKYCLLVDVHFDFLCLLLAGTGSIRVWKNSR